jgi:poly(hydroxyalkanoate) granule-associated protein
MATQKKTAKKLNGPLAATQDKLLGTVHQVWLAGLGAVAKAQSGAPKLMDELVEEGAKFQARISKSTDETVRALLSNAQTTIRGRVDDARDRASDTFENLEKIFQARVQRALKQLGVPSAEEIEGLSNRVEVLNANIDKLTRRRKTAGTGRMASRSRAHTRRRSASATAPAP